MTMSQLRLKHVISWNQEFLRSTLGHEVSTDRSGNLLRVRVGQLGTKESSWEVITSGGYLMILGDLVGPFVFKVEGSAEDFFLRSTDGRYPFNTSMVPSLPYDYWAEKVVGVSRHDIDVMDPYVAVSLTEPDADLLCSSMTAHIYDSLPDIDISGYEDMALWLFHQEELRAMTTEAIHQIDANNNGCCEDVLGLMDGICVRVSKPLLDEGLIQLNDKDLGFKDGQVVWYPFRSIDDVDNDLDQNAWTRSYLVACWAIALTNKLLAGERHIYWPIILQSPKQIRMVHSEEATLETTQSTSSSSDESHIHCPVILQSFDQVEKVYGKKVEDQMKKVYDKKVAEERELTEADKSPNPEDPETSQVVVPSTWVLHDREGNGHKVRVPKGASPEAHALWEEALWELTNPDEIRPLIAWFESDMAVLDSRGLPSVPDFEERYRGTWESFSAFAQDFVNNSDLLRGVDEGLVPYFSWTMWAQDLEHDYTVVPAMGYESSTTTDVYVFADI